MDISPDPVKKIRIFRYHYSFPPADYARLRRLITEYESLSPKPDIKVWRSQLTGRDYKLFFPYSSEIHFTQRRESFAHHEFHHIKNFMVFDGIMCKPGVKRLTAENTYRLEVENERSAYLSQTIYCINRYLKNGNFDDYSMFDDFSKTLPDILRKMTDSQKLAYLTDMNKIVSYALNQFESTKRENYDEKQFKNNTKDHLLLQPVDVPEDINGEQYRLIRSAYYSIAVYNPLTGKTETRNLSKYIKPENEVQINARQMQDIVESAKAALKARLKKFNTDSGASGIDLSLLDEARAFYCKQMRTPRIICDVQTINVADLINGKPQPDEHKIPVVEPTSVPTDKANWSDDLQKYWSKFEGYNELAKNNLEYGFSIKDQEIHYTSQNKVSLSKNCQYEVYERLVKEPSNAKKAILFEKTLSKEQALMLYVACINNGKRMRGLVPTDLSAIDKMTTIPQAERDKFKAHINPPANSSTTSFQLRSTSRAAQSYL